MSEKCIACTPGELTELLALASCINSDLIMLRWLWPYVRLHMTYQLQVSVDRALGVQEAQEGNIDGSPELWGEAVEGSSCGASLDHALTLAGGTDPCAHVVLDDLMVASRHGSCILSFPLPPVSARSNWATIIAQHEV